MFARAVTLIFGALLASCGTDSSPNKATAGETTSPAPSPGATDQSKMNSFFVQTAAALPACTTAQEGALAYVKAESKFYGCSSAAWAAIDVRGDKGDKGDAGAKGDKGDAGKDGTSRIGSSIYCTGALENSSLSFTYKAAQLDSGDVFVEGSIYGALYQLAGAEFFSSQQVGYEKAPVLIGYDAEGQANYGLFKLSLDRKTLVVTIDYQDNDGPLSWTMAPNECVVNKYD